MSNSRQRSLWIETPEGVRFALPLAGPAARFLAWVIDALAIGVLTSAVGQTIHALLSWNQDWLIALDTLAYFVITIGYAIVFEWRWRGQSVGKRVLGLRVMDAEGLRLRFSQIVIRNVLRLFDALPLFYLVGGATMMLTRDAQRLGDLAANTIVVRQRRGTAIDIARISAGKFNTLLEYPHLAARLRQNAGAELIAVALEALLRREELEDPARVEVFARLAARFRELATFPEEATAALTDEQYVRGAVEVATRSKFN